MKHLPCNYFCCKMHFIIATIFKIIRSCMQRLVCYVLPHINLWKWFRYLKKKLIGWLHFSLQSYIITFQHFIFQCCHTSASISQTSPIIVTHSLFVIPFFSYVNFIIQCLIVIRSATLRFIICLQSSIHATGSRSNSSEKLNVVWTAYLEGHLFLNYIVGKPWGVLGSIFQIWKIDSMHLP